MRKFLVFDAYFMLVYVKLRLDLHRKVSNGSLIGPRRGQKQNITLSSMFLEEEKYGTGGLSVRQAKQGMTPTFIIMDCDHLYRHSMIHNAVLIHRHAY